MSLVQEQLKSHGLESQPFDEALFENAWGKRLVSNGYADIEEHLRAEAEDKFFLAHPLTPDQVKSVNDREALTAARGATAFQNELAQTTIEDSMEPLVNLRAIPIAESHGWTFTDTTYHEACGEWAGKERLFWLREDVTRKLLSLAEMLASFDLHLHFEDGFRPLGVQEGLFQRRIVMARTAHPEWTDEEVLLEAKSKTAFNPRFAAHKAGAAVDARLADNATGSLLDIGHDYPDGGEIVRLNSPFVTQNQWQNRKIYESFSRAAGLSMYPFEDWHLSSGDATAAVVESTTGAPYHAVYGPVKEFDAQTGKILSIYDQDELDAIFDTKPTKN